MPNLSFFVPGIPIPKGSAKAFMRPGAKFPNVVQTNREKQKPWASIIGVMAQQALNGFEQYSLSPVDDMIGLNIQFFMPAPKYLLGKIAKKIPVQHTKKPDLDKLVRCVMDALTGICYSDDSQVAILTATKNYAVDGKVGAQINVTFE